MKRNHGNIIKWIDDRGFGFVDNAKNAEELFVHISEFPKNDVRPKIGELISFEIEIDKKGKKRAVRVQRTGSAKLKRNSTPQKPKKSKLSLIVLILIILGSILLYNGYQFYSSKQEVESIKTVSSSINKVIENPMIIDQKFVCDGRQHCAQMNSRAEANYFNKHCPNMKMDGDNDGIPCENDSRF